MARNETVVEAPIAVVWQQISDAASYGEWVVGANAVHEASGDWPGPGATFVHSQGPGGPFTVTDTTTVLEGEEPRRLLLEVRIRPFVVGKVLLSLREAGPQATRVTMDEWFERGLVGRLHNPLFDKLIKGRNVESLRRLSRLAERRRADERASTPA